MSSINDVTLKTGGGGNTAARSGRQRAGATTAAAGGRGFTSIDRRLRTNNVQAARVQVGARTQRSVVRRVNVR